ncbi:MAG: toxin [Balneolaceae bacterium]|nr:MAG: toxin [Balneolaceae bacterium]
MKYNWDIQKNELLKKERGITFERICVAIEQGRILDILEHPDKKTYGNQKLYVLEIDSYVWVVPFRDDEYSETRFLITAFPSRKLQKIYKRGNP